MTIEQIREAGLKLEQYFKLETMPIGLKWLEKASDAPEGTKWPKKDLGKHMALCQAFSYARMKGMTIALGKEDHWCWNPLIGYGNVECVRGQEQFDEVVKYIGIPDKEKAENFFANFPRLPYGKYEAVVIAPLKNITFEPDVVMIYSIPAKINHMCRFIKSVLAGTFKSEFDGIDSCIYCTVPSFLNNEYRVTLPDPGERERARCKDEDIILTVPGARFDEFINALNMDSPRSNFSSSMFEFNLDFGHPPFYNRLFEIWGLDKGEEWKLNF